MNSREKILLKSVKQAALDTFDVLAALNDIPSMADKKIEEWQKTCLKIPKDIQTGLLKIAVAGVIKSGKSTFINSFLGKECVKHGAGVITSITTRIRRANKNQAHLYLKTWDGINHQIRETLSLFPEDDSNSGIISNFDLRRKKDRDFLKTVYNKLIKEFPVTNQGIRPEAILIGNALEGYAFLKEMVKADDNVLTFSGKDFENHKAYTGDAANAFFIKDVLLEVYSKRMDLNIEIADCQGTDSTDPAQLFQIVDYLKSANIIVYCVSSRTGFRQADMTFLKVIKNLGLLDNILFVNNCDLSEHDSLDDLKRIERKMIQDLELLKPGSRVYSFSFLYNLFEKTKSRLLSRNRQRFEFWKNEKKMSKYCTLCTSQFDHVFQEMLKKDRFELIISNHIERLLLISRSIQHRLELFLDLLSSEDSKTEQTIQKLKELQQNTSRLKSIVRNSLKGAVEGLTKDIESQIDNAFFKEKPELLERIRSFVLSTPIEFEQYREVVKASGFNHILYLMFQDFRLKLDHYLIKEIMPKFKLFVTRQEEKIEQYFRSLSDSYQVNLIKVYTQIGADIDYFVSREKDELIKNMDIINIKKIMELDMPHNIISTKYTAAIKVSSIAGFGLETLVGLFSSLFNPKSDFSFSPGFQNAANKIKKEILKNISQQLDNYHIGLKNNYFLPLIEAVKRDCKLKIKERFDMYDSFIENFEGITLLEQSEKEVQRQKAAEIKTRVYEIFSTVEASKNQ
jgi:GTPase SAR1 family protein